MLLIALSLWNSPTLVGKLRLATKHSGKKTLKNLRTS